MKMLIAGNWKMNCSLEDAKLLIADIINGIHVREGLRDRCEFLVCPSFIYMPTIRHAVLNHNLLSFGAQDCSDQDNGAFTGDISATMLKESGCQYVIVGHSERRGYHAESNALVKAKAQKVVNNAMCAIICVGETEQQRSNGEALATVLKQLEECVPEGADSKNIVIAYEPVWAIGTGKVATTADIDEIHTAIRQKLKEMLADGANIRILYGGSVKPDNAGDILNIPDVNGALIGGASLQAQSFLGIAEAAQ
ncbi:MAG: triose-phosphate isomerase [Micavibrio sp.]|nr:triose-phosphate isomerase [Micavibrio sp.]|tara:strand:+ start:412 stop:1167 length:756 start_codon:yes stop_codon:yes gene_type:complete